ncbi:hypothetical protein M5K25_018578 [Dendrobium thyrsiflorum]|uniref:Chlorophyll a-b binding protein, chloroplastic n=1 Tax=Dendrobium thyrsiflorum TaxID=117978 RepID=A0ABD0UQI6_DENTH
MGIIQHVNHLDEFEIDWKKEAREDHEEDDTKGNESLTTLLSFDEVVDEKFHTIQIEDRPKANTICYLSMAVAAGSIASFKLQPRFLRSRTPSSIASPFSKLPVRVGATKGISSVCEPLPPDRPLWFPGSSPPEWLDGSLPGDFGFDPLGLGSDPELLQWFAQAELMHGRWAMLAVAGILIPECLVKLGFMESFSWYDAGVQEYFADPLTLFFVQMALMGWVEGRRWADLVRPGSVEIEPKLPNRESPKPDVGYPGGLWFDPMQWGRGSPQPVMVLRTKEIKNGRLAMLAFMGFWFQAIYTGEGPLDNLMAHIADPGHCNIFLNSSRQQLTIFLAAGQQSAGVGMSGQPARKQGTTNFHNLEAVASHDNVQKFLDNRVAMGYSCLQHVGRNWGDLGTWREEVEGTG